MRLFIAIQLSEEMKASIRDVQEQFKEQGVKGNYTPAENMHMTLAFIGEYNDPDRVLEALEAVEFEPFTITMNHVGNFDDLWWTGITESNELSNLVKKIRHPPLYTIFFKAKDGAAIDKAMEAYAAKSLKFDKEKERPSVLEKLDRNKKIVAKTPRKVKEKKKVLDR